MPLSEALDVLDRDRGKHFDPVVLDAFIRYYERDGKQEDAIYAHGGDDGSEEPDRFDNRKAAQQTLYASRAI
jgi:hypothetical protein